VQYEVDLYQTESNCQTPLERQYHTDITANERSQRAAPTVSTFKNREGVSKATEDVQVAL